MPTVDRVREISKLSGMEVTRKVKEDPNEEGKIWILFSAYSFDMAKLAAQEKEVRKLLDELIPTFNSEDGEKFYHAAIHHDKEKETNNHWTNSADNVEDLLALGCALGLLEVANKREGTDTKFRVAPNGDYRIAAILEALRTGAKVTLKPAGGTTNVQTPTVTAPKATTATKEGTEGMSKTKETKSAANQLELEIRAMQVERSGTKLVVPESLSYEAAIEALKRKLEEDSQEVQIVEKFDMTVPEGAIALFRALNDLYGFVDHMRTPGFFGSKPPALIKVQTSPTESVTIPWGRFGVPGVTGYIETNVRWQDSVPYFGLSANVSGRYKGEIERLAQAVRLQHVAIYKGKSIRVAFPSMEEATAMEDFFPQFITLTDVSKDDLIFTDDVQELVEVALFTPIEKTQFCREYGVPLKRGILLEGPYGVGKTLTVNVAAKLCERNGWTFIQVKRARDLPRAIAFGILHQPSLVFCEDIDEVMQDEEDRDEKINAILNQADGVDSKGAEIITVFTTNDLEAITKAMLRPGRIDTVVPVRPPDARAAQRLVRLYAGKSLPETEDLTNAGHLLSGHNAAVVREVVTRSKLSAVRRVSIEGQGLMLLARDIEIAAMQMEAHSKLLEEEPEDDRSDIEKGMAVLAEAVQETFRRDGTPSNHALPPLPPPAKRLPQAHTD
jgi:transitional endoplasmic reticulum ATPase